MEKVTYLSNGQWLLEKATVFDFKTKQAIYSDKPAEQAPVKTKDIPPQSKHANLMPHELKAIKSGTHPMSNDANFVNAYNKLGDKKIEHLASRAALGHRDALELDREIDSIPDDTFNHVTYPWDSYRYSNSIGNLSDDEYHSVKKYLNKYHNRIKSS